MGAFFIRRSFSGDKLFPGIFARYLSELVQMEVPIEFFIEGGRSRTGKLLPPKLGVLSMIFEAAQRVRSDRQVTILPIYIGYARIAEEKVFERELSGARKEPESVRGVVRASRVLNERYGKVYVRVADPLDVKEEAGAWSELSKEAKQERLRRTGRTILSRIDGETLILPVALTALSVLAHGRRGIRHEDLLSRATRFMEYLRAEGVKEPPGLRPVAALVDEAVRVMVAGRILESHEGDGSRVYSNSTVRRIRLEYYKNSLLPPLATVSWYCAAIRALGKDLLDPLPIERLFARQFEIFEREFIFSTDQTAESLCTEARLKLLRWGLLLPEADGLRVRDRSHIGELANLTTNFLESYQLVLKTIEKGATDVPKAALSLGKTLLAVDELSRPESLNLQNLQNAAAVLAGRSDLPSVKADLTLLLEGTA
jgi:glycerol-3-phosphate O-acyltransferase